MKDIFKFDKKYFKISLYVVISICVILFFYQIISNPTDVFDWLIARIRGFFKWLSPVLYGFVIAYLLHKPCSWLEAKIRNLKRIKFKNKQHRMRGCIDCQFLALVLWVSDVSDLCRTLSPHRRWHAGGSVHYTHQEMLIVVFQYGCVGS
jgi:hypothetical protein